MQAQRRSLENSAGPKTHCKRDGRIFFFANKLSTLNIIKFLSKSFDPQIATSRTPALMSKRWTKNMDQSIFITTGKTSHLRLHFSGTARFRT